MAQPPEPLFQFWIFHQATPEQTVGACCLGHTVAGLLLGVAHEQEGVENLSTSAYVVVTQRASSSTAIFRRRR